VTPSNFLVSSFWDFADYEMMQYHQGVNELHQAEVEMGNLSPESYNEDGMFSRICTQFSWGTRYNPPFVHSSNAINAVTSTLGKLGK
jgi:hypothetical protein